MEITAQMVKELREATNAGMMDCKKALKATDGDMEKAVDYLREKGLASESSSPSPLFLHIYPNAVLVALTLLVRRIVVVGRAVAGLLMAGHKAKADRHKPERERRGDWRNEVAGLGQTLEE